MKATIKIKTTDKEKQERIYKIACLHTWRVIRNLPKFWVSEFEDILQEMLVKADAMEKKYYSEKPFTYVDESASPCSLYTYLYKCLNKHSMHLTRHYMAGKRKVIFYQVGEESEGLQYLLDCENSYTPSFCLSPDVAFILDRLEGDRKALAVAMLNDKVSSLGWNYKKVYRVRMSLKTIFKQYGY